MPEHQELMTKIGLKLQELRKVNKLSVSGLAAEVGISRNSYSQMENGRVYFHFEKLLLVLQYHKKDALEFFNEL